MLHNLVTQVTITIMHNNFMLQLQFSINMMCGESSGINQNVGSTIILS